MGVEENLKALSLIVSNDSIMKPPYEITPAILKYIFSISEKIGQINAAVLFPASPHLRKQNQIKTIHASLKIEGNTLSEDQITAIVEKKRVIGPPKDILEVQNALEVYNQLENFNFGSVKSFLNAHKLMMRGLIESPGNFRTKGVGIMKGDKLQHMAPPAANVPYLIKDLFQYLNTDPDPVLIKSCVFHYELEFIHPFMDGNGRMGRLWQSLILIKDYPIFKYFAFESLIAESQDKYYESLSKSDKVGHSTIFIEYLLQIIDEALTKITQIRGRPVTQMERLHYFRSLNLNTFTRKDYMNVLKNISTATASRDLTKGVQLGLFTSEGSGNLTTYHTKV